METHRELLAQDTHDRILADRVHPPGWSNPQPIGRYNLVVIGAGTAGLVSAAGAAGLGAKVALIERNLMGGDCLNVGCVPSKGVISAARAVHAARESERFGVRNAGTATADFAAAMERMRSLRAQISDNDSAQRFRDRLGVDVFFGQARFTGPDTIEVEGRELRFARAALCTGARAAAPPIPGLEAAGFHTNETVFTLTELPPRLAVIGGGPIGCELAQSFARFGSRVSIIQHGPQLLGREDLDAAGLLAEVFRREGIEVHLNAEVIRVEREHGEKVLVVRSGEESLRLATDVILVAVGRAANIEGLELERAGIAHGSRGVQVDDRLRTTNPRVYAAGDICSAHKFTHTADAQARILIANALFGGRQQVSSLVVPWCTYTDPEIAHVGMYEHQAKERGLAVTTLTVPLAEVDRAVLEGETEGFARVHLKKGTDRILGATIVARHAGEMLGELTLAMTSGLGLSAIGRAIHPYPTQAEAVRKLADAYNRSRLTPGLRRVMGWWFRLRR